MFQRQKLKMIDSHVHIRVHYDDNLEEVLAAKEEIRRQMGLTAINVASVPGWDTNSAGQNLLCILFKALYPHNYAYAGLDHYVRSIDKSGQGRLEQLEMFMQMGFDGIKCIEYKPTARKLIGKGFNTPDYRAFFAYLEKHGIPILWHVADPEENWRAELCSDDVKKNGWCYDGGGFLSKEELMEEVEEVLAAFPSLRVVFAHLCFLSADADQASRFMNRYPNVRLDITPGIEMYYNFSNSRPRWREFFVEYSNRILLGTDNGWGDESAAQKVINGCGNLSFLDAFFSTDNPIYTWEGKTVKGLALSEDVLRRLYADNFMDMQYGRPPRALDLKAAADYADALSQSISEQEDISPAYRRQARQAADMLSKLS